MVASHAFQSQDTRKQIIDVAFQYIFDPNDKQALAQIIQYSPRGTYAPIIERRAKEHLSSIAFSIRDKQGIERRVRMTPMLYCFVLIADALGHTLHINRRARESHSYLRLVPARAPGNVKSTQLSEGKMVPLPDERMPFNFDMQRILYGAGQQQSVHPKSDDRFNLTYENWTMKGGSAKTDQASLVLALLTHPAGWTSPFGGTQVEQEAACKAVLFETLKALEVEREAALKARAA